MTVLDQIDFRSDPNWAYLKALGRGFAGAILFSLPLLMTMEMWWLGFYLDRPNLVQFVLVNFLVLVGLGRISGFESASGWSDDIMDAFAAYAVAAAWSLFILLLLGIIHFDEPPSTIIGKVALESIPASFGAMLASKNLGGDEHESAEARRDRATYVGQLFIMLAGALFVGFSVAPTEEMILISFLMTPVQSMGLVLVSILLLHAMVYTVGFRGQEKPAGATGFWSIFLRFTIPGYAIAVIAAFYLLWTFGRVEGTTGPQIAAMVAVLAFPGAVGAAVARLVV